MATTNKAPKKAAKKAPKQAKKVAVQKAPETREPKGKFHIEIQTKGEVHTADVDDIAAYISSLGIKWVNTKTVIHITYQKKTVDRVLMAAPARMLFNNKLRAEVFAKNVMLALNAE